MSKFWIIIVVVILAVVVMRRRGESTPEWGGQPPTDADIDRHIMAGQKIEAIKAYRFLHGVGLKEAKDAVEAREKQLPKG